MDDENAVDDVRSQRRKEWNSVAVKLAPRAEKLENPHEVFAETIFFEKLKSNRNSIVLGRRGTGKTILLKTIEWECASKFEKLKTIPVYINGSQLRNDAQLIGHTPNSIALSLYIEFVKCITENLNEFINRRIEQSFWDTFFPMRGASKAQELKSTASQLYDLLEKGDVRYLPAGDASQEIQTLDKASGQVEGGVGFSLSDPKNLGWKLSLDAKASKELEQTGLMTRNIQGNTILPLTSISNKIGELLKLIDGGSLVILFDEWSDVSPNIEAQPLLADMIKRTFAPNLSITLKLACIPNRTRLSARVPQDNPIPIGLEIGDDIFRDVDLDKIVFTENDLSQIMPYFLVVLKKHMSSKITWLKEMSPQAFEAFLLEEIFASEDVFSELCQASAANTRDFITLFVAASTMQIGKQIELVDIREAAAGLYEDKSEPFSAGSREMRFLQFVFENIFAEKKSYYFLIPEETEDEVLIKNLWVERLIHKTPFNYFDLAAHVKYPRYQIDYSKCVDLLKAEAAKKGEEEGRIMAAYIKDVLPEHWISGIVNEVASAGLPMFQAWIATRKAITEQEAGKIDIESRNLIVDPRKINSA